ncbi:B12-binding domain-containing protein [Erythrobacter sp. MTPC3]|uniref:cobalamin B12-binding domain-containing protein n=1 Tax=Erythrobacter sp. MTPC3 TaxID=3056564 RepID=UPI0036F258BB
MASNKGQGVIEAGQAALRRVIANPLARLSHDEAAASTADNDHASPLSDDSINSIIEGEIIPRLLMAHAASGPAETKSHGIGIAPSDANAFAALPLRLEAANLVEEVDNFINAGVSVDAIYIDLLAPAARKLGEMWEADECDFIDVTMGLWRLQEVMREISSRAPVGRLSDASNARRAIFASMPGDQHSFGALMIDEVFSQAGWYSEAIVKPERRELLDRLAKSHFDVAGLTISRDCPSAAISSLITAMRSVSANENLVILIGGRLVNQDQSIVSQVGADGTGADARAALEEARRLVRSSPVRAQSMR